MFGSKKKEANKYYDLVIQFGCSIMFDKDVFPEGGTNRGVPSIVMGLCCFLLTGFMGKTTLVYEIIDIHRRNYEKENKTECDIFLNKVQEYYLNIREHAINVQEKTNNSPHDIVRALADKVADLFNIKNTDRENIAIQEYIGTFLSK